MHQSINLLRTTVLALGAIGVFTAAPALADNPADYKGGTIITLEEASKIASEHLGGTVTVKEVDFDDSDSDNKNLPVFEVEVLKDNVEHEVVINAKDGTVLSSKIDD